VKNLISSAVFAGILVSTALSAANAGTPADAAAPGAKSGHRTEHSIGSGKAHKVQNVGTARALNPQPLPPGFKRALNPQPLPPGLKRALNPQPLPPG
jgi:hypothetical protein